MNYLLFPVDGGIHGWYVWYVCPLVTWLCIIACHREKYMSESYIESPGVYQLIPSLCKLYFFRAINTGPMVLFTISSTSR